jgi:hypothetical protein
MTNLKSLKEFSRILRKRRHTIQRTCRDFEESQQSCELEDLIAYAEATGRLSEINDLLGVITEHVWRWAKRRNKITLH